MEQVNCYSSDSEAEEEEVAEEQIEQEKPKIEDQKEPTSSSSASLQINETTSSTTSSKRSLPELPEDIIDKFAKRPRLPHPEFYDRPNFNSEIMSPIPGIFQHYAFIDIRTIQSKYQLLNPLIEELKTYLRMSGYGDFLNTLEPLHQTNLSISRPLHVSLSGSFGLNIQQTKIFDEELRKRIPKIIKDPNFSKKLTFGKFNAYPSYDRSEVYFALDVSEESKKSVGKILNVINELKQEIATEGQVIKNMGDFEVIPDTLHCSIAKAEVPQKTCFWTPEFEKKLRDTIKDIEIDPRIEFQFTHMKVSKERQFISYPLMIPYQRSKS